jgi:hypothetical protein
MKSFSLICLLTLAVFSAQGQTIIPGGYVSGTWASSQSPFHIQGNIEIPFDSTLVIEPGVEVYFDGSYNMTVHGRLDASGNVNDSIIFTANDQSVGWKGIDFYQINEALDSCYLKYCSITFCGENINDEHGAIYIYQCDNILMDHCLIAHNVSWECGGIMLEEADIQLSHSLILKNRAIMMGAGGLYCINSAPILSDLEVISNESPSVGGLYYRTYIKGLIQVFKKIRIYKNKGGRIGGLDIRNSSNIQLEDCNICFNTGDLCGGIAFIGNSTLIYPQTNKKNSVYMNKGGKANELYTDGPQTIEINIDTFSVWIPDDYHVYPKNQFHFADGIQHAFFQPIDTSLYISPGGSDSNDGFSPENALRSFDYALRMIEIDKEKVNTLWILPGLFNLNESDSGSGIYLKENVRVAATENNQVFIDGNSSTRIITAWEKDNLKVTGVTVQNGFTRYKGGAIYIYGSSAIFDSCDLISNYGYDGGGAFIEDTSSRVIFNYCKFLNNSSLYDGGGIQIYGTGTFGYVKFNFCDFIENYSNYWGGGLRSAESRIHMFSCRFISNQAAGQGGGIEIIDPIDLILTNCTFIKNTVYDGGGGIGIVDFAARPNSVAFISNCTFSDNTASYGTTISVQDLNELRITNSIFWNSEVSTTNMIHMDYYYNDDTMITRINHSNIQGGDVSIVGEGGRALLKWEDGNITTDPAFIDPASNDYSLNWNSPCIEAGKEDTTGLHLPETDLNGDPRIVNPRIDMGAYEFQFPVGLTTNKTDANSFKIYPAVTKSIVTVEFPGYLTGKSGLIKIYSANGIQMEEMKLDPGMNKIEIDVSGFSSGIYFVTCQSSGIVRSKGRFIVVK